MSQFEKEFARRSHEMFALDRITTTCRELELVARNLYWIRHQVSTQDLERVSLLLERLAKELRNPLSNDEMAERIATEVLNGHNPSDEELTCLAGSVWRKQVASE